jgi:hypothetical protein
MASKVLLGLTTFGSDWREKIKELIKLEIDEVALFPTGLNEKERLELYSLLDKSTIKKIPHVHLRNDMKPEELEYFIKNFGTKYFNLHCEKEFPLVYNYDKYLPMIYWEDVYTNPTIEELEKSGGICFDFAHAEHDRLIGDQEKYDDFIAKANKYKIGCCHVSAIKEEIRIDEMGYTRRDSHVFTSIKDLEYLKNYKQYFPEFISIELENSIAEQLEVKKYIETLIS